MARLLIALLLLLPAQVMAEHMDVIEFELEEGCSLEQHLAIVADFNEWGKEYGYHARIAVPVQSHNLTSYYWLGTSANAGAFGQAWDAWRDALPDAESVPAKLWARFQACSHNLSRRGYDVY